MKKTKHMSAEFIAKTAILGGIAGLFTLVHISVWFAPPFYKIDLGDAIILIGGFALGPSSVMYMQVVKILLNFLVDSTTTFAIGEFANFAIGVAFVWPASFIYHKKKDFKFVVIGLVVSTIFVCIIASILNVYVTIPAYSIVFGIPIDDIISMGTLVNSSIIDIQTLVLFAIVPFNILKCTINSIVSISLYKKLSKALNLEKIE